jgi:diguanylate cyclase (GGDEF)-like protein
MVHETRDKDTIARVGGDEFVLILVDLDDRARLASIARRLIDRLEQPISFGGETCRISASIGIVLSNQRPGAETALLIGDADAALYEAKRAGRADFRFFESVPVKPGSDPAGLGRPKVVGGTEVRVERRQDNGNNSARSA